MLNPMHWFLVHMCKWFDLSTRLSRLNSALCWSHDSYAKVNPMRLPSDFSEALHQTDNTGHKNTYFFSLFAEDEEISSSVLQISNQKSLWFSLSSFHYPCKVRICQDSGRKLVTSMAWLVSAGRA